MKQNHELEARALFAGNQSFRHRAERRGIGLFLGCAAACALHGAAARGDSPAPATPAPSAAPALSATASSSGAAVPPGSAAPGTSEPSAEDVQEANLRFQEGKALLEQGAITEACEKLARSLVLYRRGGTLLNLAACRQRQGRHATALRLFQEAFDAAKAEARSDRMEIAQRGIVESRGLLSWIVITVAATGAAPGLTITLDGAPVPASELGSMIAVDPGAHTIAAEAPGRRRFEGTVQSAGAGDRRSIEVPTLVATAASTSVSAPSVSAAPTGTPDEPARTTGLRIVGFGMIGAGAVAAVVGAAFGGKAISDSADSRRLCPQDVCPTAEGLQKNSSAREAAVAANALLPSGIALAAAGVLVLFLAPSPRETAAAPRVSAAPWASPTSGGFVIGGKW